jgi:hypothetical protein
MSHGTLATSALGGNAVNSRSGCKFIQLLSSPIYSASALGNLFITPFHSVLLNVWLTFAAFRIFSHAASYPHDAAVVCLTKLLKCHLRGSPPGNLSSSFAANSAALIPPDTSRSASSSRATAFAAPADIPETSPTESFPR